MSRIGKISLVISFAFFIFSTAFAADITFNASVDKNTAALDDTVQYTVSVSGNSAGNTTSPNLPKFVNLSVMGTSQSSNISIVNGQMSVSKSFIYTLQPERIGQAHIGSASININGQTYTTEPIDIKITKAEGNKTQHGTQTGGRSRLPGMWDDFDEFFKSPFHAFANSRPLRIRSKPTLRLLKPLFMSISKYF